MAMTNMTSSCLLSFDSSFSFVLSLIAFVVAIGVVVKLRSTHAIRQAQILRRDEKVPSDSLNSHKDVFPPSQRHVLNRLFPKYESHDGVDLSCATGTLLAMDTNYKFADPKQFIFSGFSIADIRSLGDFPDYSALSEVPLPTALKDFTLADARARPYRPLRWPYHQTMAIQKMEPDYWLELQSTYKDEVEQRLDIVAKNTSDVLQALPGSELACKELMEMVIQFLCARYPNQFIRHGSIFTNHIRGMTFDTSSIDPLHFLAENVPEDFAILLRDPETGVYKFRAGVICASTGWNLASKIGLGLPAIHGPVPDYDKMRLSMDRFFTKMPTSKPVQRGAWSFEIGEDLYVPPGHSNHELHSTQDPNLSPDDIFFRVDWQTLRRLPLSGAVVFNFKAFFTPLAEMKDEPYIPSLCLKILNEGKANIRHYKRLYPTEHVIRPLLVEYEKHQIQNGQIEADWQPETLKESPFFPSWEAKGVAY